jgi:Ser/Thr protein kinase RdoA (MazF antagonist)
MDALVEATLQRKLALVHGDVSPKNILVAQHGPIFLDAECAWYGDPAFDVAFLLSHLLLKCVWVRCAAPEYLAAFDAFSLSYRTQVTWEDPRELWLRVTKLLPALLLARVDGKSPVEYLSSEASRSAIRRCALHLIGEPAKSLRDVRVRFSKELRL